MSGRVHVHIGGISLRGFTTAQRDAIVTGLRTEMARLLSGTAHDGAWNSGRSTAVVNGGQLRLRPGASGSSVGRTVAQSIVKSVRS